MLRVSTPVPDYSGSVGGVHFANGQALVDDELHEAEVGYFLRSGYVVEGAADVVADEEAESDVDDAEPQPAKNASTAAWQTWAVDHGGMSAEDAGALSRDELVARFADSEENE